MARGGGGSGSNKSLAAIQKLLAEKVQIERWLDRLSLAGDKTPEAVRQKVSVDYRKKLEEVTRELGAFGEELTSALKRAKASREGLARQEKTVQEQLSEAEVRHAVGEFDETKWRQVNAEFLQALVRVREEVKNADEEIAKLEDVVNGMSAAEKAASDAPDNDMDIPSAPPVPPMGKTAVMQAVKPIKDELAFLKSVTEDDKAGPSPARASGSMQGLGASAPPPPPPPKPAEPPPKAKPRAEMGAGGVTAIDTGGQSKKLTGTSVDKSLKCKECGTMNMPTEWYCESCGAELSAI